MEFIPVRSSNVGEIGYDEEQSLLAVRFLDGSLYYYYDVSPDVWHQFVVAPSKGSFIHRELKGNYAYERVE